MEHLLDQLVFSVSEINRHFKIKAYQNTDTQYINKALGVRGLLSLLPDAALINRLLSRAFSSPKSKVVCRLRRGLVITFYAT